MQLPSVTFLMPAYNAVTVNRTWFEQSIKTMIDQDYGGKIEILIVDDGSKDETAAYARRFAGYCNGPLRSLRVRLQEHAGITVALNNGLRLCTTDLIARQDSDDFSSLDRIRLQVEYLLDHPETGLVGSALRVVNGDDVSNDVWNTLQCHESLVEYFRINNPIAHGCVLFRRELLRTVGYYNEQYKHAQDYDYFWRISQQTRIAQISQPVYNYRIHRNRVTADGRFRIQASCSQQIRNKIRRQSTRR